MSVAPDQKLSLQYKAMRDAITISLNDVAQPLYIAEIERPRL